MANYDSGHYFLTMLAPVRMDSVLRDGQSHSRRHLIRQALDALPTDENTIVTCGTAPPAPFARNKATHFARFVVLDDLPYNGKVSRDSLVTTLLGALPAFLQPKPVPVDQLSTPFLFFVADFDAASGAEAELDRYLEGLWGDMQAKLTSVLQHCVGFEKISSARDFAAYVKSCQVETTMPFNDYWVPAPDLRDTNLIPYRNAAFAFGAVFVLALLRGLWRPGHGPVLVALVALLALLAVAGLAIRCILAAAAKPFPASQTLPATLPNVLKALYLQRAFAGFAVAAQGQSDEQIFAAFGDFLNTHRPDDAAPTQEPGVIGA